MLHKYFKSERGNFAVITGILMLPLLAAVAGVVDYTFARNKADQLQNSLDASALAIATKYFSGMSNEELRLMGQDYFDSNIVSASANPDELTFNNVLSSELSAIASAEGNEDFITVGSALVHQGILGSLNWPVYRRSIVRIKRGPPACILALDPHAASSIKVQGSSDVGMVGCVIASNSDSDSAVHRGGSAKVRAACIHTVGATSGIKNSSNVSLDCAAPLENQYPSFDPLANVSPPPYTGCQSLPGGKTKKLSPGTFCNRTFSGAVTLEPGNYVLRGGQINLGATVL